MASKTQKLSIKALALTLGIVWAAYVCLIGVVASVSGYWMELVNLISVVYLGFSASVGGIILGTIQGFIDGLIAGAVIALIYNKLVK